MKVRSGFVSNSSTSSFVCLITAEAFEQLYDQADLLQRVILDKYFKVTPFADHRCYSGGWVSGNYDSFDENGEAIVEEAIVQGYANYIQNPDERYDTTSDELQEARYKLEQEFNKLRSTDQVFIHGEDF